jgi:hypothetical protein
MLSYGKTGATMGSSITAVQGVTIMKSFAFRTLCLASLATLLSACGIGAQTDLPTQTAASIQADVGAAAVAQGTTVAAMQATIQVASAAMPAPDCAADGCTGLRIIDGNAEAARYAAMQHGDGPQG